MQTTDNFAVVTAAGGFHVQRRLGGEFLLADFVVLSRLDLAQVDDQSNGFEEGLVELTELIFFRNAALAVHQFELGAGEFGIGDELGGEFWIVGVGLNAHWLESEEPDWLGGALEDGFADSIEIDGVVDGQAQIQIVGWFNEVVDADGGALEAATDHRVGEGRSLLGTDIEGEISLAGGDGLRTHSGFWSVDIGDGVVGGREVGVPVVRIALQHQLGTVAPALEHVRTSSYRILTERFDTLIGQLLRRQHHQAESEVVAEAIVIRLHRSDIDGEIVDDFAAFHGCEQGTGAKFCGLVGIGEYVPAGFHRVGIEGFAVGEGHALAEGEAGGAIIDALPAFRQNRHKFHGHSVVVVQGHANFGEGFVDGAGGKAADAAHPRGEIGWLRGIRVNEVACFLRHRSRVERKCRCTDTSGGSEFHKSSSRDGDTVEHCVTPEPTCESEHTRNMRTMVNNKVDAQNRG